MFTYDPSKLPIVVSVTFFPARAPNGLPDRIVVVIPQSFISDSIHRANLRGSSTEVPSIPWEEWYPQSGACIHAAAPSHQAPVLVGARLIYLETIGQPRPRAMHTSQSPATRLRLTDFNPRTLERPGGEEDSETTEWAGTEDYQVVANDGAPFVRSSTALAFNTDRLYGTMDNLVFMTVSVFPSSIITV
jgi:hypothetical protein